MERMRAKFVNTEKAELHWEMRKGMTFTNDSHHLCMVVQTNQQKWRVRASNQKVDTNMVKHL